MRVRAGKSDPPGRNLGMPKIGQLPEQTSQHESYGLVGLYRHQHGGGKTRLFGSSLENHYDTIVLRLHRAKRVHSLARDWYHTDGRIPVVEIELSAAQFAEMITTPNTGDGVPCTIRNVEGRRMADVPEGDKTEAVKVREDFRKQMAGYADAIDKLRGEAAEILGKKSLTQADRQAVLGILDKARQDMRSNVPFIMSSFEEASEKVVSSAKAEIDAAMTRTIHAAGIGALRDRAEANQLVAKSSEGNNSGNVLLDTTSGKDS